MSTLEQIGWGMLLLASLAGSWLCSGMETGIYTVDRIRLRVRLRHAGPNERNPDRAAARSSATAGLLLGELDRPADLLATLLIGNNLFGYLAATALAAMLERRGWSPAAVFVVSVAVLTPLVLIVCEAFPKELFRIHTDTLTPTLAPIAKRLRQVFTWTGIVPAVRWFAGVAARWLGGDAEEGLRLTGGQRLVAMLRETVGAGLLSETQASLVDRALLFHSTRVGDEMTPWHAVRAISIDAPRRWALGIVAMDTHSRYPVVDARGQVLGIVRIEDVCLKPHTPLRDLLLEPARIPPSMPLRQALGAIRASPGRVAIVERDRRPLGLATLHDLAEPLVGQLP